MVLIYLQPGCQGSNKGAIYIDPAMGDSPALSGQYICLCPSQLKPVPASNSKNQPTAPMDKSISMNTVSDSGDDVPLILSPSGKRRACLSSQWSNLNYTHTSDERLYGRKIFSLLSVINQVMSR
jgi:hypothetical protein